MTTPYDARTVEACIEAIESIHPDEFGKSEACHALLIMPVAGWTRERPKEPGYWWMRYEGEEAPIKVVITGDNGAFYIVGTTVRFYFHEYDDAEFCPLPTPPADAKEEK